MCSTIASSLWTLSAMTSLVASIGKPVDAHSNKDLAPRVSASLGTLGFAWSFMTS